MSNKSTKKGSIGIVIAGIVMVLIIAMLVGVIVFLLISKEEKEKPEEPRNVIVSQDNVDEVIQQMEEEAKVPVGEYEVSMSTTWVFPDGKLGASSAFVENSTANTNMMYFIITVDDEEIYHSDYLDLGASLRNDDIILSKDLEAGFYDAVITYHLVDDDFGDLSQVSMRMRIQVEG